MKLENNNQRGVHDISLLTSGPSSRSASLLEGNMVSTATLQSSRVFDIDTTSSVRAGAERFVGVWKDLQGNPSPREVARLGECVAENMHFKDPFTEVHNRADYVGVMQEMYAGLKNVEYDFGPIAVVGERAHVDWEMSWTVDGIRQPPIIGHSSLTIDSDGKVVRDRDYWDSEPILSQIPLVGWLISKLKSIVAKRTYG